MPVYEYLCEACGKPQEAIQKFSDSPLTDCELCGGKGTLKKQISRSSFALKGSGWYTTDYKRSSKPAAETAAPAAPANPATPAAAPAAATASPAPVTAPANKPKSE
jgi:putative FmdB family regulatory protein